MGLPKKGTRTISVDKTTYKWVVSPDSGYMWLIVEQKDTQGQRLIAGFKYHNTYVHDEAGNWRCFVQQRSISPSLVKSVILLALKRGWKPTQSRLGAFSFWADEEFPIAQLSISPGIPLQEIALDIVSEMRYDISMDMNWRYRLFHACIKQRFEIPFENEYGLKFAAFLDGWTDNGFWIIGIESINFPHIVMYTTNGVL
ncbi:hypothetical protein [Nostoc sp.]|uniref:hypothetical protein n=1 Tax=Nostoc sp. TaxID=1180 RepID=UPI002FF51ECC